MVCGCSGFVQSLAFLWKKQQLQVQKIRPRFNRPVIRTNIRSEYKNKAEIIIRMSKFEFLYLGAATFKPMIPFYRKRRKEHADDNQFLKYSRYAIGEIVLVVIGILIALQINNWNEVRKEQQLELQLLKSFKNGLQKDLSDINFNMEVHEMGIAAADSVLDLLEGSSPYNPDSVARMFSRAMTPTLFVHSTSAFETLKSKGVTLISNELLRDKIIEVYDARYKFFTTNEKVHYDVIEYGLRTVFPTRFEDSYEFDLNTVDFVGALKPLNFEDLKTDQEFLYYFRSIKNRLIILVGFHYTTLKEIVVELIDEIDAEIQKRESS